MWLFLLWVWGFPGWGFASSDSRNIRAPKGHSHSPRSFLPQVLPLMGPIAQQQMQNSPLNFPYLPGTEHGESAVTRHLHPPAALQSGRHRPWAPGHSQRNCVNKPHQSLPSFEALPLPRPPLLSWYTNLCFWLLSELLITQCSCTQCVHKLCLFSH